MHKVGFLLFQRLILPHGRHTLGIECRGVLSTGVGNRVGVGLTRSTIISFALIQIFPPRGRKNRPHDRAPLPRMADSTDQAGYFSQAQ